MSADAAETPDRTLARGYDAVSELEQILDAGVETAATATARVALQNLRPLIAEALGFYVDVLAERARGLRAGGSS